MVRTLQHVMAPLGIVEALGPFLSLFNQYTHTVCILIVRVQLSLFISLHPVSLFSRSTFTLLHSFSVSPFVSVCVAQNPLNHPHV